ncbi:MAG: type II toxin-antitoxin system PemK/MazF family toxin [Chloroflexota bacterium]|nr:type II toxin-antitoxin system PemK/MazF family toxin [Chloroflexota bacterium]
MIVKRYDIYLANLDPTIGSEIRKTRPVVIVSDDMMNKYLETVVACPLTTKLHSAWRSRIQTTCQGEDAEIAVDQIRALSKLRLIKKLDRLSQTDIRLLRQLITEMYGE